MNVAGIDYSITSPGVSTAESMHAFGRKSWQGWQSNIYVEEYPYYSCEEERHHKLAMWAMGILKQQNIEFVCIEGYSMGSKGRVFNLGENTGHLKKCMWMSGIEFVEAPPTSLKLFAVGHGGADKTAMVNGMIEHSGIDLLNMYPSKAKKIPSMITDLADAYWCRQYGIDQIARRSSD